MSSVKDLAEAFEKAENFKDLLADFVDDTWPSNISNSVTEISSVQFERKNVKFIATTSYQGGEDSMFFSLPVALIEGRRRGEE